MRFKLQLLCDNRHSLVKMSLISLIGLDSGSQGTAQIPATTSLASLLAIRRYLFLFFFFFLNEGK